MSSSKLPTTEVEETGPVSQTTVARSPVPLHTRKTRRPARPVLASGTKVGRYVIIERLDEGGVGVVYSAYDPELERRLAIKLLRIGRADCAKAVTARSRFLREAQALAQLAHPNVISVFDVGEFREEVFIAMVVHGTPLARWLRREERLRREVIRVFADAGAGLAAAHAAGLVHRDFKPGNVIVGSDGRVRVIDFGLARAVGGDADIGLPVPEQVVSFAVTDSGERLLETPLTQVGHVAGTPAYMAPEQHLALAVDARADQFSFCVALYEALYRERPYVGVKWPESVDQARRVREPPAGARVSKPMRRMLLRGLAPAPEDRFPTMDELLAELARDPWRRWRVRLAAVAVVAVVAAAALWGRYGAENRVELCQGAAEHWIGIWDPGARTSVHKAFAATGRAYAASTFDLVAARLDSYARRWSDAFTESCRATRAEGHQSEKLLDLRTRCLMGRLRAVEALVVQLAIASGDVVERAVRATSGLPALASCSDLEALLRATPASADSQVRQRVEALEGEVERLHAQYLLGRYQETVDRGRELAAEARAIAHPPLAARALHVLGRLEEGVGDRGAAKAAYTEGLLAAARARDDDRMTRLLLRRMGLLRQMGHRELAFEASHSAEAALLRAGDPIALRATWLNARGNLLMEKGDLDDARACFVESLALRRSDPDSDELEAMVPLHNLGYISIDQGRHEEGQRHLEESLAITERLLGAEHPEVAASEYMVGYAYIARGMYQMAYPHIERSLAIHRKTLPHDHPRIADTLQGLGAVQLHLGRLDNALATMREALAIATKKLGPGHAHTAMAVHNIGSIYLELGDIERAGEHLERALVLRREALGDEDVAVALTLQLMARVRREQGQLAEAVVLGRRGLGIREARLGGEHPLVALSLAELGRALGRLGRPGEAERSLRRALAIQVRELPSAHPDLASVRLSLAEVLWREPGRRPDDLAVGEAVELARFARQSLVQAPGRARDLARVDAWLNSRGIAVTQE